MDRITKSWLIIAVSLILAGCIIFLSILMTINWDFSKLSINRYETKTYDISGEYRNIIVETYTSDVVFAPADNGKFSMTSYEQNNLSHSVTTKDDTLYVRAIDTRKWYEYIGINFGRPKITVYLPMGEYGRLSVKSDTGDVEVPKDFRFESVDIDLSTGDARCFASVSEKVKIKTSTGDIYTENILADLLELSVSTGKVVAENVTCSRDIVLNVSTGKADLTNIQCRNFTTTGNTGDLSLKNMVATENLSIERSTGDIRFDGCDAAKITIKTDTGDVTGTLLTEKIFVAETDTGKVNVPRTTTGGICQVTTDTGDIKIMLQ